MAELYLARASGLHGFEKLCVLKLVLPHLVEDRRFVEMFLHEARMAATLDHPNLAQVTDIGELEGEPFFVMQYVRGRDLRKIAKALSGAPLPLDVALTVTSQVAAGLHYVHDRQLVHRDVSPANVMIGFDGDVKLVDFGIAKSAEQADATRTGVIKGKVSYMSPEQCRGDTIDRRTDVFALGILLCEATTGRRLFRGETDYAIMSKIVDGTFPRPSEGRPEYPEALEAIVLRALQNDPADRYQTAAAMQADLEAFAQDQGLRLSTLTLSSFMRELYGEQSDAADTLDEAPTEIRPDAEEGSVLPMSARATAIAAPDTAAETVALPDETAPPEEPSSVAETPESTTRVKLDELPRAGWTVIAPPPPEPQRETVVAMVAGELDDAPPPSRAWVYGVAAAIGAAVIAIAALAMQGEDQRKPGPTTTQPVVPVLKADIAQEPAPPVTKPDEPLPAPETIAPETPPSEPETIEPPRPKTPKRSQRPRPATKAKTDKRPRGLDDMYPGG